ncbi:mucin-3B-like [Procambarus clarkii]|uniref:mucin-3B-like n=1 Tax=Procambarus clarkii TaxID=6728 RepID=UPI0037429603
MKLYLFLYIQAVLACVLTILSPVIGSVTPVAGGSCYIPGYVTTDSTNTQGYLSCVYYKWNSMLCPTNTVWRSDLYRCDVPRNATLTIPVTGAKCTTSGSMTADTTNTQNYLTCSNSQWVSKSCSTGTVWRSDLNFCDYPLTTTVNSSTTTQASTAITTTVSAVKAGITNTTTTQASITNTTTTATQAPTTNTTTTTQAPTSNTTTTQAPTSNTTTTQAPTTSTTTTQAPTTTTITTTTQAPLTTTTQALTTTTHVATTTTEAPTTTVVSSGLPVVAGATLTQVGSGAWVWTCNNSTQSWAPNITAILTYPDGPFWGTPGSCNVSTTSTCLNPAPPIPNASIVRNLTTSTGDVYGIYWECEDGWELTSGMPGGLLQCTGSSWTSSTDTCVEVPRDCSEIALNNLTVVDSRMYSIRPYNTSITAICDLTTAAEGSAGGWTLILQHHSQLQDLYLTPQQYMEVVGTPSDNISDPSYFIGLQNLEGLNWRQNGSVEPLVLKFVLVDANGVLTTTSCGPVVITPANHTLQSIGQCLGNASDALSGSVGSSFCGDATDSGPCWWCGSPNSTTCQDVLTSASPAWGSSALESVVVWARPFSYTPECQIAPQVALASTDWHSGEWRVGDTVSATCLSGFITSAGTVAFTITCTIIGWQEATCVQEQGEIPERREGIVNQEPLEEVEITNGEVRKLLLELAMTKAISPDGISPWILMEGAERPARNENGIQQRAAGHERGIWQRSAGNASINTEPKKIVKGSQTGDKETQGKSAFKPARGMQPLGNRERS